LLPLKERHGRRSAHGWSVFSVHNGPVLVLTEGTNYNAINSDPF
jgi:hypothetical protein